MNKLNIIPRRDQQRFIKDTKGIVLHYAIRSCPCDGVNCSVCGGKMKYYDDPVPINAAILAGNNSSKKEARMANIDMGNYQLIVEGRFALAKHDRVKPFGTREFEQLDEILLVEQSILTFTPIHPRLVTISFVNQSSGVLSYEGDKDFTFDLESKNGGPPVYSKEIKWLTDPAIGQKKFSVRYQHYPEYEIQEIPSARFSEGQKLMQKIPLSKITLTGNIKTKSNEKSVDAVIGGGMKYV
jgi:hypothetical protein